MNSFLAKLNAQYQQAVQTYGQDPSRRDAFVKQVAKLVRRCVGIHPFLDANGRSCLLWGVSALTRQKIPHSVIWPGENILFQDEEFAGRYLAGGGNPREVHADNQMRNSESLRVLRDACTKGVFMVFRILSGLALAGMLVSCKNSTQSNVNDYLGATTAAQRTLDRIRTRIESYNAAMQKSPLTYDEFSDEQMMGFYYKNNFRFTEDELLALRNYITNDEILMRISCLAREDCWRRGIGDTAIAERYFKIINGIFARVPPLEKPMTVYTGYPVYSDRFDPRENVRKFPHMFQSTSRGRDIATRFLFGTAVAAFGGGAYFDFTQYQPKLGELRKVTILPGSRVVPIFYIKVSSELEFAELDKLGQPVDEKKVYAKYNIPNSDAEREVLLPPCTHFEFKGVVQEFPHKIEHRVLRQKGSKPEKEEISLNVTEYNVAADSSPRVDLRSCLPGRLR